MEIIFQKLGSIILTGAIAIASLFGGNVQRLEAPNLGATIPTAVAVFQTSLASSIGTSDTSMTLVSATDAAGTSLASSTYGFVIDEGTATEEFVLANCTGTACTGMTRGVSPITGNTTVTALKKAHRRGASVKITDSPLLLIMARTLNGQDSLPNKLYYSGTNTFSSSTELISKGYADTEIASTTSYATTLDAQNVKITGDQTIAGVKTFSSSPIVPTPTTNFQAATKAYADGLVIAGGVVAENLVTGIQRVASSTQITTGYSSTTAHAIPSSLASSTASSTSIVVVTKSSTGKIDPSFLNGSGEAYTFNGTTTLATTSITGDFSINSYPLYGYFGDGADGDVTIGAGTTTLTRDMYYNNLTVTGTLITDGYKIFAKTSATGTGIIGWGSANNGAVGSAGNPGTGGLGGARSGSGSLRSNPGANGGQCGGGGNSGSVTISGTGGDGGIGGNGGQGATATSTATSTTRWYNFSPLVITSADFSFASGTSALTGGAGGGGGSGASSCAGAVGGGGGAGGGPVFIASPIIGGTFTVRSIGGNGGNATSGNGGGGGGGGGSSIMLFLSKLWTGSYLLTGGTGGTGANNGAVGRSYELNINRLLR